MKDSLFNFLKKRERKKKKEKKKRSRACGFENVFA